MSCKVVIFDLDGTLLNTIGDLGAACNHVLRHYGYPQHTFDQYKLMVGNGITKLIERALPADHRSEEEVVEARTLFLPYYQQHIADLTRPYGGVAELLEKLQKQGIKVAVASNKFESGTRRLIAEQFASIEFAAVMGQNDFRPVKPDPQIVTDILEKCNQHSSEALYVGDSGVDMTTARNAGVVSAGVTWGFRSREELEANGAKYIVDDCEELATLIGKL